MRRFVIQKHIRKGDIHWDLMLERDGFLETYRLDAGPERLVDGKHVATRIFDHDLKFLSYEGSVNDGRGSVEMVESGSCELLELSDQCLNLMFQGTILKGNFTLRHIKEDRWQFGKKHLS
jgi:bifunctional non-homologous end joining protein LigD